MGNKSIILIVILVLLAGAARGNETSELDLNAMSPEEKTQLYIDLERARRLSEGADSVLIRAARLRASRRNYTSTIAREGITDSHRTAEYLDRQMPRAKAGAALGAGSEAVDLGCRFGKSPLCKSWLAGRDVGSAINDVMSGDRGGHTGRTTRWWGAATNNDNVKGIGRAIGSVDQIEEGDSVGGALTGAQAIGESVGNKKVAARAGAGGDAWNLGKHIADYNEMGQLEDRVHANLDQNVAFAKDSSERNAAIATRLERQANELELGSSPETRDLLSQLEDADPSLRDLADSTIDAEQLRMDKAFLRDEVGKLGLGEVDTAATDWFEADDEQFDDADLDDPHGPLEYEEDVEYDQSVDLHLEGGDGSFEDTDALDYDADSADDMEVSDLDELEDPLEDMDYEDFEDDPFEDMELSDLNELEDPLEDMDYEDFEDDPFEDMELSDLDELEDPLEDFDDSSDVYEVDGEGPFREVPFDGDIWYEDDHDSASQSEQFDDTEEIYEDFSDINLANELATIRDQASNSAGQYRDYHDTFGGVGANILQLADIQLADAIEASRKQIAVVQERRDNAWSVAGRAAVQARSNPSWDEPASNGGACDDPKAAAQFDAAVGQCNAIRTQGLCDLFTKKSRCLQGARRYVAACPEAARAVDSVVEQMQANASRVCS